MATARNPKDFTKATAEEVERRVRELTKPKVAPRLTLDSFKSKYAGELAALTGEDDDEAQAARYRAELNRERDDKLSAIRKQKEMQKPGAKAAAGEAEMQQSRTARRFVEAAVYRTVPHRG